MSPSESPFHLWIAQDDTQTMVALAPLRFSERPMKHEWGSITHLRAFTPVQKGHNVPAAVVFSTLTLIGALGLFVSGVPPLAVFVVAALVLVLCLAAATPSSAPVPELIAPDRAEFPALHHLLHKEEEQKDFSALETLAERAGRALPAVDEIIDPAEGGRLLAQALWEAAEVLSHRQQLRPGIAGWQDRPGARPPDTHVARILAEQRESASKLWHQTEAELQRLRIALELAAIATENAAQEADASEAVRAAYRELAELAGERV
ncbi:hypothetical protein [Micromonospora siamensis]|uniref:Uncharacterized protein n=1 Tax=Micromonospora siamensis TaxID=299152 RepID=A0A1C5J371_9ACTN|nr:hypothetical protein [Micromonospora siamensis]SCG64903.1 hypothetical protein GA0074704_4062 [Micromonospora siamensis]